MNATAMNSQRTVDTIADQILGTDEDLFWEAVAKKAAQTAR